jgi:hypothetical protein
MTRLAALFRRGVAVCLALLACGVVSAHEVSAGSPARMTVRVPQLSNSGTAMLELSIKAVRDPGSGNLGGVVRIKRAGGNAVEVGRFSIFPAGSFTAANADEERRFQFNATSAIRQLGLSGGQAEVEVALTDRSSGVAPAGAALTLGSVQILLR